MKQLYIVLEHYQGMDSESYYYHIDSKEVSYHTSEKGASKFIDEQLNGQPNQQAFSISKHGFETEIHDKYTIKVKPLKD